ncbi:membrane protein [Skermanella stibiiresistens SB22]|uniref:Membrane protein n=1 Tax=Skermanella stibiiresistens SB22 TaxID=1385369 RepID=W9H961_9PROT|nr:exosortase A [Skermanella stibiiresistens]EWY41266.1 membrane protein [Skermanella stibiiresistens SB22]
MTHRMTHQSTGGAGPDIRHTALAVGADPAWPLALTSFAGLAVLMVALLHDVAGAMAHTWWTNVTYNHGFFVLPTSLYLIWLRRAELRRITPRLEPLGLVALVAMMGGWLLGRAADVLAVEETAMVGMLIGLFVFIFGRTITRRLVFPLAFLFFMVPVGDALIPPLQDLTAQFAVALLRLIGIPVFHDGIMIEIPNGLFRVAEACAGVRFLIANVVISALFAHLAYRRRWKFWLFLGIGFVLPIVANGFRAFGIILIAHLSDGKLAAGVDHLVYGWLFFSIVMIVLLAIGNSFADRRLGDFSREAMAVPLRAGGKGWPWRIRTATLAAFVLLAGPAYAWTVMAPAEIVSMSTALPAPTVAGWRQVPGTGWQPDFPGADRTLLSAFEGPEGRPVELFVAYYAQQRQGAEVVYYANQLQGGGWSRVASGGVGGIADMPTARLDRMARGNQQKLVLSWYWVGGRFTANEYEAKLYQSLATLFGVHPAAAAIAVAADTPEDAARFIGAFALEPYLDSLAEPPVQ